jgi:hypothetical protein
MRIADNVGSHVGFSREGLKPQDQIVPNFEQHMALIDTGAQATLTGGRHHRYHYQAEKDRGRPRTGANAGSV